MIFILTRRFAPRASLLGLVQDTTPEILTQGNKFINQRTPTPQISETPPNLLPNDGGIGIRRGKRVSISDEIDYSYGGGPIDVEKEELRSSKIKIGRNAS